ncbi:class I SAM-dependent methyltransferase [Anderseniella sp. Alg231-50]|uniref:class I SAM-dependent methyltransferase n=1 Tax=Anderseniella sp. Alg231-50 TaxID=1922226 RepID=UPI000D556AD3
MKNQPAQYLRAIHGWFFKPKPWPLAEGRPWMCRPAVNQLEKLVVPGMRILEWGSGGSTVFFAERGAQVTCIEHDPVWARLVRWELARRNLNAQVNINQIDLAADYVDRVEHLEGSFDLVIVDGRRRVECVSKVHSRVVPAGWLVLDDSDRQAYLPAVEQLAGWHKLVLKGPRPHTKDDPQTTMWQKPDEDAERGC